jgi:hypothetical protein
MREAHSNFSLLPLSSPYLSTLNRAAVLSRILKLCEENLSLFILDALCHHSRRRTVLVIGSAVIPWSLRDLLSLYLFVSSSPPARRLARYTFPCRSADLPRTVSLTTISLLQLVHNFDDVISSRT